MKTWLSCLGCIVIMLWLNGCVSGITAQPATQAPQKLAAGTLEPIVPTASPTGTASPTAQTEPTITRTPRPTVTPQPEVVWSDVFPNNILDGIGGIWSPTGNTFLYWNSGRETSGLCTATGPEFQSKTLLRDEAFSRFLWSLDGQKILYEADTLQLGVRILVMDASGENAHILDSKAARSDYRWLKGWLDQDHIIYTNYWGGGHESIAVTNIRTGEVANVSALIHGGDIFPAQNGFIPATTSIVIPDVAHLLVISETFPSITLDGREFIGGNVTLLPIHKSIPRDNTSSTFQDWMPASSQILVSWAHFDTHTWEILDRDLILWDVERHSLSLIAPDGRSGMFSPDGQLLAYLTEGAANLNEDHIPVKKEKNAADTSQDYMQLLDVKTGQAFMSLPVIANPDRDRFDPQEYKTLEAQFSPDGRYLAFLSPGKVETDSSGWPVKVEKVDPTQTSINVLDLLEKKLVWSVSSISDAEFSWSPAGSRLIYQDAIFNWLMLNIGDLQLTPITLAYGEFVDNAGWSYDGQYLSLVRCLPLSDNTCKRTIHIFDAAATQ